MTIGWTTAKMICEPHGIGVPWPFGEDRLRCTVAMANKKGILFWLVEFEGELLPQKEVGKKGAESTGPLG